MLKHYCFRWETADAEVACRHLGYSGGEAKHDAYFGQGEGRIWLDDVECRGHERELPDCIHRGWGNNNCGHGEDAGVVCDGGKIRLNFQYKDCIFLHRDTLLMIRWSCGHRFFTMSNHVRRNVWDGITYPFLNCNGYTVEVWEWMSNFIPHFIMDVISCHGHIKVKLC